jgi:ABC-type dipeptide/oligopeptide/nickel transport system ATPase subunit
MSAILEARGLRKIYQGGDGFPIEVLAGVDLSVSRGEFVAIVGASWARWTRRPAAVSSWTAAPSGSWARTPWP